MKGFILGLIVGAVAFGLGDALLRKQRLTPAHTEEMVTVGSESPQQATSTNEASAGSAVPTCPAVADALIEADEAIIEQACAAMYNRRSLREQAAREAEPKDPGWSYSTEQQLLEFTAHHPQAGKFQITSVDCRTTYCELKAVGGDNESVLGFQKAMEDVRLQIWNGFTVESGSGSSSDGTRMTMYHRFRRQ